MSTAVWWLVGPQGSGKSRFAQETLADYERRGLVAHHAETMEDAKLLLSQRSHASDVISIRHRAPYSQVVKRIPLDLVMVEAMDEPGPHIRRFIASDRIVRFPLQPAIAPKKSWLRRMFGRLLS